MTDEERAREVAGRIVNEAWNSPSLAYPIIAGALRQVRAEEAETIARDADDAANGWASRPGQAAGALQSFAAAIRARYARAQRGHSGSEADE